MSKLMSLPFAKISQNWASQEDDGANQDVEILHHRNKIRYDQCSCRRCVSFRYQKGIWELEIRLGRKATPQEVQQIYNRVQNGA